MRLRLNNKLSSLRQLLPLRKRPKRRSLSLKEKRNSDSSRKRPSLKSSLRRPKLPNWRLLDKKSKLKVLKKSDALRRRLMLSVLKFLLPKLRRPDSTTRKEILLLPSNKRSREPRLP